MDEQNTVVKEEPVTTEPVSEDIKTQELATEIKEEFPPKDQAGDKTPPNLLLKSLQEERDERRRLEEELKKVKESSESSEELAKLPDFEYMTESEKYLAKEILQLKEKAKWEEDLTRAKSAFPELGEKTAEFKDYCYKYPKSVDVEVLARSFLFNRAKPALESVATPKKGLEKPTGGSRQGQTPELSLEDIKRLRETQPRLYEKMIKDGKLKKVPEK